MNKKLIVFRGIPGSGKSTMAKTLQKSYICAGYTTALYEADMYFMTESGEYKFDGKLLGKAHEWCRNQVSESLDRCQVVIVANTNLTEKEMKLWEEIAKEKSSDMDVFHLLTNFGTIHGVPQETIDKMKEREIDWPGESKITAIQRTKK